MQRNGETLYRLLIACSAAADDLLVKVIGEFSIPNKSVMSTSHLGSQHDAARCRCLGACRSISAYLAWAAASGRCRSTGQTDGQTGGHPAVTRLCTADHFLMRAASLAVSKVKQQQQ